MNETQCLCINWNLHFFSPFLFLSVKSRQGTLDIINVTIWHWMRSFLFPLWHSLYRVTPSSPWESPLSGNPSIWRRVEKRPSDPRKGGGGGGGGWGSLFVPNNGMVSCGSSYCVVVLSPGVMEPHQVGLIRDSVNWVSWESRLSINLAFFDMCC